MTLFDFNLYVLHVQTMGGTYAALYDAMLIKLERCRYSAQLRTFCEHKITIIADVLHGKSQEHKLN